MNTQDKIITSIADYLGLTAQDIDRHASLREELNLGSIELNDLLNHLSKEFDVTFDPEDVAQLSTVDDLIVLVEDNSL
jgi:acyl carrier protein